MVHDSQPLDLEPFAGLTPGPWERRCASEVAGWCLVAPDGTVIADVLHLATPAEGGPINRAEAEANRAALTAAADLVAECRRQREEIVRLRSILGRIGNGDQHLNHATYMSRADMAESARAALSDGGVK